MLQLPRISLLARLILLHHKQPIRGTKTRLFFLAWLCSQLPVCTDCCIYSHLAMDAMQTALESMIARITALYGSKVKIKGGFHGLLPRGMAK